jgi:hypothetical protein
MTRFPSMLFIAIYFFSTLSAAEPFSHEKFNSVLKAHLKDGLVNYTSLKIDKELDAYLDELNKADIKLLGSREEKIAFWINAYNAYTLKLVADNYPVKSIRSISPLGNNILAALAGPWSKEFCKVGGKIYSLNQIEHEILRGEYKEVRVHFAVNCASISCPVLREEAYHGEKINSQLDDQAKRFLSDSSRNRWDPAKRTFYISKIFDWYQDDFVKASGSLEKYLAPFFVGDAKAALLSGKAEIEYLEYNWNLNEQKK